MDGHFITDCGLVRKTNEDAGGVFKNKANQILAIVADGMGGHQAGEVASASAVAKFAQAWDESEEMTVPVTVEEWLNATITKINTEIFQQSTENETYKGMGTTIVVAVCTDEFVTIAHVGDSRCYLLNGQSFEQLTKDHSLVNELIRTGQISEDDALEHPRKNVLIQAIGTEESVQPEIHTIGWDKEHVILLSSDGLTNMVSNEELEMFIRTIDINNIEKTARMLVKLANERGGEDNITVAIVAHHDRENVGEQ